MGQRHTQKSRTDVSVDGAAERLNEGHQSVVVAQRMGAFQAAQRPDGGLEGLWGQKEATTTPEDKVERKSCLDAHVASYQHL